LAKFQHLLLLRDAVHVIFGGFGAVRHHACTLHQDTWVSYVTQDTWGFAHDLWPPVAAWAGRVEAMPAWDGG